MKGSATRTGKAILEAIENALTYITSNHNTYIYSMHDKSVNILSIGLYSLHAAFGKDATGGEGHKLKSNMIDATLHKQYHFPYLWQY